MGVSSLSFPRSVWATIEWNVQAGFMTPEKLAPWMPHGGHSFQISSSPIITWLVILTSSVLLVCPRRIFL